MAAISMSGIQSILRLLKLDEEETAQVSREQSDSAFTARIAYLQNQIAAIRKEASQTGMLGVMGFLSGLLTSITQATGSFSQLTSQSGFLTASKKSLLSASDWIGKLGRTFLDGMQGLQKAEIVRTQAKQKEEEIYAEVAGRKDSEAQREANEARTRAQSTLRTIEDVQREWLSSQSILLKI